MPTVEERLAALETKLAALTDTTPTTYYEHQYSGEEIDNAVSRALPNGAIDQAVGTFVRPNLLDNWYFGRPVDQRGGYIVPKGVNYYKVDGFVPQGPIPETVKVDYIDNAGSARFNYGGAPCYVPKDGGYVRGYIPTWNGYSIDRWSVESDSEIVITLVNGGIRVKNTANVARQFKQILPIDLNIAGMMITISALVGDIIGTVDYVLTQVNNPYQNSTACSIPTNGLVSSSGSALTGQQKIVFVLDPGAEITLLAAKLELGPTQTLAHKEGDRWVLNEVPKYSRELLDCRTYFVKFGYADKYCILGSGVARDDTFVSITVPIPAAMRTYPVVILTGVIIIRHSDGVNQSCNTLALDAIGVSSILLKIKASGLTPGDAYEAFLAPGNYLDVSCDL